MTSGYQRTHVKTSTAVENQPAIKYTVNLERGNIKLPFKTLTKNSNFVMRNPSVEFTLLIVLFN